jgi:hypothetical protein
MLGGHPRAVEGWEGAQKSRPGAKGLPEEILKEEPVFFSSFWPQKVSLEIDPIS